MKNKNFKIIKNIKYDQNVREKNKRNDGANFIALRLIVFEIMEESTLTFGIGEASPIDAWSNRKTMSTIGEHLALIFNDENDMVTFGDGGVHFHQLGKFPATSEKLPLTF